MIEMRRLSIAVACMAAALCLSGVAQAGTGAPPPKGEAVMTTVTVTATVTKVDPKTREVTLRKADGEEVSFVAGDEVKNLAQVTVGDVLTATYAEAIAFEVKKGGAAAAPASAVAAGSAEPGQKPAGAVLHQTKATVLITAIDPDAPSVTFKGPKGNTRTIKVLHPERLQGVSVGDTVEITYTEALAIKVEEAATR